MVTSVGAGKALEFACELESGVKMPQGMHTFFWIVMGTDIDNEVRGPGWYNSIGWKVMGDHDYNVEESNEEARRLLEENLQKIQDNPGKAAAFSDGKRFRFGVIPFTSRCGADCRNTSWTTEAWRKRCWRICIRMECQSRSVQCL